MMDVAVSLSCVIDGVSKTFLLENVQDTSINESSSITRHPVPTGDYVSDSMYKEPISMSVSGMFSLSGRKGLVITNGENLTLENIEQLFQRIKNEGILCDLIKIKVSDNNLPLFLPRRNMALTSISWTERINSLGFSFSFQQVMQVDIQEYDVDPTDENLPDDKDPKTLNFTESLLDVNKIAAIVTNCCKEWNIAKEEFLQIIVSYGKATVIGLVAGLSATLAAIIIGGVTSGGLLLVAGLLVGIAATITKFITDIKAQHKSKVHIFKKHISKKKNEEEVKRYIQMNSDILNEFETLNDKLAVYQVSSDAAHQAILNIDDEYYCFTFTRNNTDNSFGLTILDLDGNIASDTKSLSNIKSGALSSLDDCNAQSSLLRTTSGYQAFLLNLSETRTDKLTECYILISSIDMGSFNDLCQDIIKNYLLY